VPSETSRSRSCEGGTGEKWDVLRGTLQFIEGGRGISVQRRCMVLGWGNLWYEWSNGGTVDRIVNVCFDRREDWEGEGKVMR